MGRWAVRWVGGPLCEKAREHLLLPPHLLLGLAFFISYQKGFGRSAPMETYPRSVIIDVSARLPWNCRGTLLPSKYRCLGALRSRTSQSFRQEKMSP